MFVKIPPSQLGKDEHKIDGFSSPWGIAINNKQEVMEAESTSIVGGGNKINIMDRDGKQVQTIESDEF